ncbi:MAG: hypothetical protein DRJ42_12030 [Deltaproteobacteria bacterium]|nr:MAG: hypothetical protein DRJ42_12030 [Deltaproteobacteria bacterium]
METEAAGGGVDAHDAGSDGSVPTVFPGTPCEAGEMGVCFVTPELGGDEFSCQAGTAMCEGGYFGECENLGPAYRMPANAMALISPPAECSPCDPACSRTTDYPNDGDLTPTNSDGVGYDPMAGGIGLVGTAPPHDPLMDTDGDGVPDPWDSDPTDPTVWTPLGKAIFHVLPLNGPSATDELTCPAGSGAVGPIASPVDVYFLVDTTNSNQNGIDRLGEAMNAINLPGFEANFTDIQYGVGYFDDYPIGPHGSAPGPCDAGGLSHDTPYGHVRSMTTNIAQVRTDLASLSSECGGDDPDSHLAAIFAAATGSAIGANTASVPPFAPYLDHRTCRECHTRQSDAYNAGDVSSTGIWVRGREHDDEDDDYDLPNDCGFEGRTGVESVIQFRLSSAQQMTFIGWTDDHRSALQIRDSAFSPFMCMYSDLSTYEPNDSNSPSANGDEGTRIDMYLEAGEYYLVLESDGVEEGGSSDANYRVYIGPTPSEHVAPQVSCPGGTFGYPCFRDGAYPFIVMFSGSPMHGGWDGGDFGSWLSNPASGNGEDHYAYPTPTMFGAAQALRNDEIRFIGFHDGADADAFDHMDSLAQLSPPGSMVVTLPPTGADLADALAAAIRPAAGGGGMDITFRVNDDPGTPAVDERMFVDAINTVPSPATTAGCVAVHPDWYEGCAGGTDITFAFTFRNDFIGATMPDEYNFTIDIMNGAAVLESIPVTIVVPPGMGCGGVTSTGDPGSQPVDIIVPIDNSSSMSAEITQVINNINTSFSGILDAAGTDYQIIFVTRHGPTGWRVNSCDDHAVCVTPPLAGGACDNYSQPIMTDRFKHYSTCVNSNDAFRKMARTFDGSPPGWAGSFLPNSSFRSDDSGYSFVDDGGTAGFDEAAPSGWSEWLRPGGLRAFLMITDDNSNQSYTDLLDWMYSKPPAYFGTPADPNWIFHSIQDIDETVVPYPPEDPVITAGCSGGAGVSDDYQHLARMSGGLRYPICQTANYDDVFTAIAGDVVAATAVDCDFPVGAPPAGESISWGSLTVNHLPGTGGPPEALVRVANLAACFDGAYVADEAGRLVTLCTATCTRIQADTSATVEMNYLCDSDLAVYVPGSYSREYDATETCLIDTTGDGMNDLRLTPEWYEFRFTTTLPSDSFINFEIRTAELQGDVASATPIVIPVPPTVSPVDMRQLLRDAGVPNHYYLSVTANLMPSSDGLETPILHGFEMDWRCVPAE